MGKKSRPGREQRKPKKDKSVKIPDLTKVMTGLPKDNLKSLKVKMKFSDKND